MKTSVKEMDNNIAEMEKEVSLEKGASFWGYVSPRYDTSEKITKWKIEIKQENGTWSDVITSQDPRYQPQTPGLSGTFEVRVTASGPNMSEKVLTNLPDSRPDVGCNSNCVAMVGIVSNEDGTDAYYWTVWDAICKRS